MKNIRNPFEFEAANYLSDEDILDFYIEDHNYSRFLQSTRNIFLVGERGTGKTMMLMYNSVSIQYLKAQRDNENFSFDKIGIHISCNTPLFHKREHLLIEEKYKASIVCEHYLALSIVSEVVESLGKIPEIIEAFKPFDKSLKDEFKYTYGFELYNRGNYLESIQKFVNKENIDAQKKINGLRAEEFYSNALSFSSFVLPFLRSLKTVPLIEKSHFMLMIDDAHDLNSFQLQALNSWIAYRDHSDFSFKIATASVNSYNFLTSTGGTILEGHDYTLIEMGKSLLNKDSQYAKMAEDIIRKRLLSCGILVSVKEFFPTNPKFLEDISKSEQVVRERAISKFKDGKPKQISDYVYKYGRAEYFRQRSSKANRPPYSGFDSIVNISTGVIRNLLDPCYYMFDEVVSDYKKGETVDRISYTIQDSIIQHRSEAKWEAIKRLHKIIDGCSEEMAHNIYNLFANLMALFKQRLLKHNSEPRAIYFAISQRDPNIMERLFELLTIAQKAQLLYTRQGNAKDDGKRETYYVPNRILLPAYGLDPVGQHAHVQLKAVDIWMAAYKNKAFPFVDSDNDSPTIDQPSLFDTL